MDNDDTLTGEAPEIAAAIPQAAPKKSRKSYRYWGVYDTGDKATPEATKQYVEQSAKMLSDPTKGGKTVCILKAPKGSSLGETTGICYVNGVRQANRKRKK